MTRASYNPVWVNQTVEHRREGQTGLQYNQMAKLKEEIGKPFVCSYVGEGRRGGRSKKRFLKADLGGND